MRNDDRRSARRVSLHPASQKIGLDDAHAGVAADAVIKDGEFTHGVARVRLLLSIAAEEKVFG